MPDGEGAGRKHERPLTVSLFRVHFQREVSAGELNRLTGSKPEVARPLVLTWISRSIESRAMTRDLEFSAFVPSTRRNLFGRPALFRR